MQVSETKFFYTTTNIYKILKKNHNKYFIVDLKGGSKVIIISNLPIKFDNNYNLILQNEYEYTLYFEVVPGELIGIPAGLYGKVEELLKQIRIEKIDIILKKFKKADY